MNWSLVIYGTAEQPYYLHHKSVRSVVPLDNDVTEEYSGESYFNLNVSVGLYICLVSPLLFEFPVRIVNINVQC